MYTEQEDKQHFLQAKFSNLLNKAISIPFVRQHQQENSKEIILSIDTRDDQSPTTLL